MIAEEMGQRVYKEYQGWASAQEDPQWAHAARFPWEDLDQSQKALYIRIGKSLYGKGYEDGYDNAAEEYSCDADDCGGCDR